MHGLGNDYLVVNALDETFGGVPELARAMCDRNRGVGADGVILILPSDADAHARMRIYNADGSEAQMCGNGIRCVGKYLVERGIFAANPLRIQTGAGVLQLEYELDSKKKVAQVTVDMGRPRLDLRSIGVDESKVQCASDGAYTIELDGRDLILTFVSMGNPHAVSFIDSIDEVELAQLGPRIERHPAFPERINAHFVQVVSRAEVRMCTWERGSGATLACGTGAAAVCAAGAITNRTDRAITARLPGGNLRLCWDEATDHISMTGPAADVFSGVWSRAAHEA
jgi:diaminopimelate epimerase